MQLMSGTPWETVTLTTLSRDRALFPSLLAEARDLAMRGQEGKLVIHTAWGTEWKPFGKPRRKRPVQSVVLEDGIAEKVEGDVKAFLDRRKWYADRGLLNTFSNPKIASHHALQEQEFPIVEDTSYTAHRAQEKPRLYKHWLGRWDMTSAYSIFPNEVWQTTS